MTFDELKNEQYKELLFDTYENISEWRYSLLHGEYDSVMKQMTWLWSQYEKELISLNVCPECGEDLKDVTELVFDKDVLIENNSYKVCESCGEECR